MIVAYSLVVEIAELDKAIVFARVNRGCILTKLLITLLVMLLRYFVKLCRVTTVNW